jgi:ATP-dependent protease HslVU (ClpYQ) peptidase subunit
MTCIVGYVDNNKVYMGADSLSVEGKYLAKVIRKDPKVFRCGDFLIGGTTSWRMLQLLRFKLKPPGLTEQSDLLDYMCTDFIDEIIKLFKVNGFENTNGNRDDLGGQFLVGYKNRLFRVCEDYHVEESVYPFNACGCGADFALGSMATNQHKRAYQIIEEALTVTEKLSAGVSAPFLILNT